MQGDGLGVGTNAMNETTITVGTDPIHLKGEVVHPHDPHMTDHPHVGLGRHQEARIAIVVDTRALPVALCATTTPHLRDGETVIDRSSCNIN